MSIVRLHTSIHIYDWAEWQQLLLHINKVYWIRPPSALQLTTAVRTSPRHLNYPASCVQRENFLANRAVNEWSRLTATTINAETVNQFKNQHDKWKRSSSGSGSPYNACSGPRFGRQPRNLNISLLLNAFFTYVFPFPANNCKRASQLL